MKSNCRRRRRLLYYTPLFSLMLEVQTSPMERARVLDFSLCFNFGFHVFCFYFFLFLPVVFWLAFPGQNFLTCTVRCFALRTDEITVMKRKEPKLKALGPGLLRGMGTCVEEDTGIGYTLSVVKAGRYQLIIFFTSKKRFIVSKCVMQCDVVVWYSRVKLDRRRLSGGEGI
ncbi:hypothetical protein DER45DRAFT_34591 [Fusarium avenaceum]|nr:hypothetical protein DER45DRAFT_34591 [Fusarium avenaceum]